MCAPVLNVVDVSTNTASREQVKAYVEVCALCQYVDGVNNQTRRNTSTQGFVENEKLSRVTQ